MLVLVGIIVSVSLILGYFASFFYLKHKQEIETRRAEEETRRIQERTLTDEEKQEKQRKAALADGIRLHVHERRWSLAQIIVTLDIILLTFTPVALLTGLEKINNENSRSVVLRLGVAGLMFALVSLLFTLCYWALTVPAEARSLGPSNYWLLAKNSYWWQVGTFVIALMLIMAGVFLMLASI